MSRERCLSLDRANRMQQHKNIYNVYFPTKSSTSILTYSDLKPIPSDLLIYCRNSGGGGENTSFEKISLNDEELLEFIEEPSFYDIPPNSSFDEVMCTMATPPLTVQPSGHSAAEKLDAFKEEITDIVRLDDQQSSLLQVDGVRKRITSVTTESASGTSLYLHKIPLLPEDPYEIPPTPKNQKDVVAIIRRARAIARLKALEKPKNPKNTTGRPKKATPSRTGAIPKKRTKISPKTGHPPAYVSDEWAAAILRIRKLAGLRTTNQKLLPKPKTPRHPDSNLAVRSLSNLAEADLIYKQKKPSAQDELDEFEILEELYDAKPPQCQPIAESASNLQNRINALQKQLLQTPPFEFSSEELDEFEALEKIHGAAPSNDEPYTTQHTETDLQDRIKFLQQHLLKSPPGRQITSSATLQTPQSQFDDVVLEDIDTPEFNINSISKFAFSSEALADDVFETADEVYLSNISMPEFNENISFDEIGLEDITSPDLCELSSSSYDLALDPDYPLKANKNTEDEVVEDENSKEPGFLTSMVNAVIGSVRNMFSSPKNSEDQNEEDINSFPLDSSLPEMFKASPTKPKKSPIAEQKLLTPKGLTIIPPHPKDPNDYVAIVKRAQAIQRKNAEKSAVRREIKSEVPKKIGPVQRKRKDNKSKKIYPPGQYSPSYIKQVARARSLAGLKNISELLNPERAERAAKQRAAREAELAAIEALPPVERIRKKIKSTPKPMSGLPLPSIETLAKLEAIRANLPTPKPSKCRWRPAARLRVDRHVKPDGRVFIRDFDRVLIPTENTRKNRCCKDLDVMSPIAEGSQLEEENLIQFSPLTQHEAQMRLRYLQEQAAKRADKKLTASEKEKEFISNIHLETPPQKFSPIQLHSPSSPRTEKIRSEKTITKRGPNGGTETIKEEVTETSTIKNGEVHTCTRQVTTKTDEYGNVTRHVQQGKGLSGEEETIPEYLDNIEPPDDLNNSSLPPPEDTSIPSPSEIIDRIRSKVKQKLNSAFPDIPKSSRSRLIESPGKIDFPPDLPSEMLIDTEVPECEITPQEISHQVEKSSSFEKDVRMYARGEFPPVMPPRSTPKTSHPEQVKYTKRLPSQSKSPKEITHIPPHPKDPKDYRAMVKRAYVIQQLKKQEGLTKISPQKQSQAKSCRVPISRYLPEDSKRPFRRRLIIKKRNVDRNWPSDLPPVSQKYRDKVARARLIHGLKNKTAALNSELAAKEAAKKAAQDTFQDLPTIDKIKKRMERLRANNRSLENVLCQPHRLTEDINAPAQEQEDERLQVSTPSYLSEREFESKSVNMSLEEFLALEEKFQKRDELTERKDSNKPHPSESNVRSSPLPSYNLLAPSMRMLGEARFFEDQVYISESKSDESIKSMTCAQIIPSKTEEKAALTYYDEVQDFKVPAENILETSQLMLETPPKNIQEKYQKLKDAQKTQIALPEYSVQLDESSHLSTAHFSPIRLISPSGSIGVEPGGYRVSSVISLQKEDLLLNIEETPKRNIPAVKQFRDLEDMPFDELEYEIEPTLTNISFEEPITPPPRPSDIIRRITSAVYKEFRKRSDLSPQISSPEIIKMPELLPDEELFKVSPPSFPKTPKTPQAKYKSPRVSLPFVWGESRLVTPVCPAAPLPSVSVPFAGQLPQEDFKEILTTEAAIVIPPHPKDPKDYTAMIARAKAIHKLQNQMKIEKPDRAPQQKLTKGKENISKKISSKPRKKNVVKKRMYEERKRECPSEPPPLPQEYIDAVARARLLRGLKNRSAALNPALAARIEAKKAAKEAAEAAYNALPEIEKIKVRMERLRKKPLRRRAINPTIEQIAYLEALKQIRDYQSFPRTSSPNISTPGRVKSTSYPSPRTPDLQSKNIADRESRELAEFKALEQQFKAAQAESLAEFEAQGPLKCTSNQYSAQPITPLDMNKLISDLEKKLLDTSPRLDPKQRYRQLMAQRNQMKTHESPIVTPVKTPEVHYSPVVLHSSPLRKMPKNRAEKLTTQITRNGNNIIKEQVVETSEMTNGNLQHFTTHATKATDSQGNLKCKINESKCVTARDRFVEELEDIQEPSFLDTTPLTSIERPRPRDIIDRISRQVRERYIPEVPTGHLVELRTPPNMLPLPKAEPQEEIDFICPSFEATPPETPSNSPTRSPCRSPDVSIPTLFEATLNASALHVFEELPQSDRFLQQEDYSDIPPHPKDPKDFKTMVTRAKKIQQLIEHNKEKMDKAARVHHEARKSKKRERTSISRWIVNPPKKAEKRKKIIIKKISQLPPEQFAREVALSRTLAGLPNKTFKETADFEAVAQNAPPGSPVKNYAAILSRLKKIKRKGPVTHRQPSLAAAAYLNAVKGAMQLQQEQQQCEPESPKTRYEKILAAQHAAPPIIEHSPIVTPSLTDIPYSPIYCASPSIGDNDQFNNAMLQSLNELEVLSEFEQPSFIDYSQKHFNENQYTPLTPPETPPPRPAAIINRIRKQYEQQKKIMSPESQILSPAALEFPKELPEEQIFEVSSPSFPQSPPKSKSPIWSPNVTIPHYFEDSPFLSAENTPVSRSKRSGSPKAANMVRKINDCSPLLGVFPGIKVKTPKCPIAIAPRLAELKTKSADLNSKGSAKRLVKTTASLTRISEKITPTPNYANVIERYSALKRGKQKSLTARELTERQHLINRQQKEVRKRLLAELKRQRQQGFEIESIKTPPPVQDRLKAIKSRIDMEYYSPSAYTYSPVKTPDVIDVSQYQPIVLQPSPPLQHLKNISAPNIEDMSMQFDDFDNHTLDFETEDAEDIEFQLAEAATSAYTRVGNNHNIAVSEGTNNYNIAKRIEMLEQQLLESPNVDNSPAFKVNNIAKRIEMLQKKLLETSTQQESPTKETNNNYVYPDLSDFDEDYEHSNQHPICDEAMDDFEAMEKECM